MKNKHIDIIGAMLDGGASKRGCSLAPTALQTAGLISKLTEYNLSINEWINIAGEKNFTHNKNSYAKLNNLAEVNEINSKLFDKVYQSLSNHNFPLVLGGDHSVSIGTISAAQKFYNNIGIIWVDAHGDFNDEFSSPSGNIHGMPLSALCGLGPKETLPFIDTNHIFTSSANVVIIGARELDKLEKERLKEHNVHVFSMSEIDKVGIKEITQKAIDIAQNATNGIYLSFDFDAIDPIYAPGVGTPSIGGLSFRETRLICEMLAESGQVIGMDFVEYNPTFDCHNITANLAIELILSALGTKLF